MPVARYSPLPSTANEPGQHPVAGVASDRLGLAGQRRFVELQAGRAHQLAVGDDLVAGADPHQVAVHDLVDGHRALGTVAHHPRARRDQQGGLVERPLGSQLLDDADSRVGNSDRQEQPVRGSPATSSSDEERHQDQVEQRQRVLADDPGDGAAGGERLPLPALGQPPAGLRLGQPRLAHEGQCSVPAMSDRGPLVGVIMGSRSDWETMRHAAETLDELGVPHEVRVVSAHRTPDLLFEYAPARAERGLRGHHRRRRRRGPPARDDAPPRPRCRCSACRSSRRRCTGMDSLLSIVQMPAGIPVGTLAIGRAGAVNAALLAAAIVGAGRGRSSRERLAALAARAQTEAVLADPDPRAPALCGSASSAAASSARMLALAGDPWTCGCDGARPGGATPPPRGRRASCRGAYDDPAGLDALAAAADVVTFEFENVPAAAARAPGRPACRCIPPAGRPGGRPGPAAGEAPVRAAGHRRARRSRPVDDAADLRDGLDALRAAGRPQDAPAGLRRQGAARAAHAGRGRRRAASRSAALPLIAGGARAVRPRAVGASRCAARDGRCALYPLVENHHREGILRG